MTPWDKAMNVLIAGDDFTLHCLLRENDPLALHGARLDLEGAAGLGRLELVRTLQANATTEQMQRGLRCV